MCSYDSKTSYPSVARFVEHVQLKDLAPRTVESYVNIVRQLGAWADGDPALLAEERVRGFFLHLKLERGWSSQSLRQENGSKTGQKTGQDKILKNAKNGSG